VVLVSLISLLVFWMPWLSKTQEFWGVEFGQKGMETIVANFDGINFLVVAKSLYDPLAIEQIDKQMTTNEPIYYSAHYPLYALVVRFLELVLPAPYALLAAIVLSNVLLAIGLYVFFITVTQKPRLSLVLSLTALFLPARVLSVRAVGSNEPMFIFFVLMSLVCAIKGKHWYASLMGALAVLTRSPGILLFGAYALAAIMSYKLELKKLISTLLPYTLMPLTLLSLFAFYGIKYGDFWAYFNSGDNLHLFFPPFMIFSNMASWVNGMWREDLIYIYLFMGIGVVTYVKQVVGTKNFEKLVVSSFGIVYGLVLLFVSHRDLARYSLPLAPIAFLGFAPVLYRKEIKILLAILVIPTFLLGWQFVVANVQPISDWSGLL